MEMIRVGAGRGFVIDTEPLRDPLLGRLVVTAAHCLPKMPPCMSHSYLEERTYRNLLGPLDSEATVWAECLFVDPVSDLAVLGTPDTLEFGNEADAYEAMMEQASCFRIAAAPREGRAWMLALDGKWFHCNVWHDGGLLWISKIDRQIEAGMSGSAITDDNGDAIGVVTSDGGGYDSAQVNLAMNLPCWLGGHVARAGHR